MSQAMSVEHLCDVIGVRFDPAAFDAGPVAINLHLTDLSENHVLGVGRSAIHHRPNAVDPDAAASMHTDRATLAAALDDVEVLERAEIDGDAEMVRAFFASLTVFGPSALIEPG